MEQFHVPFGKFENEFKFCAKSWNLFLPVGVPQIYSLSLLGADDPGIFIWLS